jgi:hypothetical protein
MLKLTSLSERRHHAASATVTLNTDAHLWPTAEDPEPGGVGGDARGYAHSAADSVPTAGQVYPAGLPERAGITR